MTTTKKSFSKTVHANVVAAGESASESVAQATTSAPSTAVTAASPMADRVTQVIAMVKAAIALLALNPPALTAAQRKGMSRLRKGGDKLVPQIAQIAQTWSVQLRTQPTDAMTSAMLLATQLQPLLTLLAGFVQEVQDTGFAAESDSWSTASGLYAVLKRMSKKDPKLAAQLAPIQEFFKYRHPVVKANAKSAAKQTKTEKSKEKALAAAKALVAEQPAPVAAPAEAPVTPVAAPAAPVVAHA